MAAIAAARQGAKVTLVETFGFPGGMATAGLVGPISKFNFAGKRVVGGLPWEFVEKLAARGLIAAEPAAFASIRVQAQCMATGQAAGIAAALTAAAGAPVQHLAASTVVAQLKENGACLM
jgi:hypothetical protein